MSPSPGIQELLDRRRKVLGPAYSHFYRDPVHLVRAEGVWMWDAEGRKYLDCYNNVASVGHCHPEVVEALHRQAQRLNTHTRYLHDSVVEYAEMLAAVLPGDISVSNLVCTGSEANDYACQIARRVTGNNGLIIVKDTYHGATTLVRDLSPAIRPDPCPDYICEIDAPDTYRGVSSDDPARFAAHHAAQIDKAIDTLQQRGHGVAAILVDSIYDGSGIFAPLPIYQQQLFTRVRAAGGLVIADEVQSGLCRLGDHYWGVMDSGVVPDIITMGKPMGDGHPLAITATTRTSCRPMSTGAVNTSTRSQEIRSPPRWERPCCGSWNGTTCFDMSRKRPATCSPACARLPTSTPWSEISGARVSSSPPSSSRTARRRRPMRRPVCPASNG